MSSGRFADGPGVDGGGELRPALSLAQLVLYGLGTTVGAGIYALVGVVADQAGMLAPLAFVAASALAGLTALSFAELSARMPHAAAEAVYVSEGLRSPALGTVVGGLVVLAGSVSAAAVANGFAAYLAEIAPVPRGLAIVGMIGSLGALACLGIGFATWVAAAITVVELCGLGLILFVARDAFVDLPQRLDEFVLAPSGWLGLGSAALVSFYAFLGFEDMVNVAEEVRDASRVVPRGIVLTLLVTVAVYAAISLASVLVVPIEELRGSEAPLALVYARATGGPSAVLPSIGMLAMINGALIQIIMGSRILYGLARRGALPRALGRLHPTRAVPQVATIAVTAAVAGLALWLPLARLAEVTSVVTLVVFALVNLSLVGIKRGGGVAPDFAVPLWVPCLGFAVSAGVAAFGLAT